MRREDFKLYLRLVGGCWHRTRSGWRRVNAGELFFNSLYPDPRILDAEDHTIVELSAAELVAIVTIIVAGFCLLWGAV